MANIINYYVDMWRNFANFGGRTNIPGYWWASLANFVVSTVLGYIPFVGPLYALAVMIPGLAITVTAMARQITALIIRLMNIQPQCLPASLRRRTVMARPGIITARAYRGPT